MFGKSARTDEWSTAHGSLRGSTLLKVGAVLAAVSILVETGGRLLPGPTAWDLSIIAWTGWSLALITLGLGFLWVGMNPVLSRVGIAVGIIHLIHAALLVTRIFAQLPFTFSPKVLVTGRLLLIAVFALVEARELGTRTSRLLLAAAILVLVKAMLPVFGFDPDPGVLGGFLRDCVPAIILALAIYHTGDAIHRCEDTWAGHQVSRTGSGFDDYNNPFNEGQQEADDSQK